MANKQSDKFNLCSQVTNISDSPINVSFIPTENDLLSSMKYGSVRLIKDLGHGGEGFVYTTNVGLVAKIYKKGRLTQRKIEKLKLMTSKQISFEGICFPVDVLYNNRNEFVGYLMPEAKGKVLQTSVFIKPIMQKLWPWWTRRDLVELVLTILKKMKYLHSHNIIMGDINPLNIQVVSSTEVYFIDTDSYQIEEFPCPVGQINFTAPELQGKKKFESYLRTFGNEYFAVATLLFMIMLPGKSPYDQVGGGSQLENIQKMNFPYPFKNYTDDTPAGPWRFCWSHLPYKLKDAFYQTFMKNEVHSTESERLSVKNWIAIFNEYASLFDSGKFTTQDPMSIDIYPTRFKRNPKYAYSNCRICSQEYATQKLKAGICYTCLNKSYKNGVYACETCHNPISFTNYDYFVKNRKSPLRRCQNCFNIGKQIFKNITCIDCNTSFSITNDEHNYFIEKGFVDPVRCKSCRTKRKSNQ